MRTLALTLLALSVMVNGCAVDPSNASKADFERRGLKWPLTVASGDLKCYRNAVSFSDRSGTVYAVNGTAAGFYDPIEPIWKYDDKTNAELAAAGAGTGPKLRISISDLIQEGSKLCEN